MIATEDAVANHFELRWVDGYDAVSEAPSGLALAIRKLAAELSGGRDGLELDVRAVRQPDGTRAWIGLLRIGVEVSHEPRTLGFLHAVVLPPGYALDAAAWRTLVERRYGEDPARRIRALYEELAVMTKEAGAARLEPLEIRLEDVRDILGPPGEPSPADDDEAGVVGAGRPQTSAPLRAERKARRAERRRFVAALAGLGAALLAVVLLMSRNRALADDRDQLAAELAKARVDPERELRQVRRELQDVQRERDAAGKRVTELTAELDKRPVDNRQLEQCNVTLTVARTNLDATNSRAAKLESQLVTMTEQARAAAPARARLEQQLQAATAAREHADRELKALGDDLRQLCADVGNRKLAPSACSRPK